MDSQQAQAPSAGVSTSFTPCITVENLDDIFTFHKWSPEQVDRGNAIRATAKELARSLLQVVANVDAFAGAIRNSAITPPETKTDLYRYAQERRDTAFQSALGLFLPAMVQQGISTINEIVMIANSAITFEAAQLVCDNPPAEVAG